MPGDRVVLGPASDGGYVLIGLKADHPELFTGIPWSTAGVFQATCDRAASADLPVVRLPMWYDIDDAETFAILEAELAVRPCRSPPACAAARPRATRALLGCPT